MPLYSFPAKTFLLSVYASKVPDMTYNVFGGTLNPAQSNPTHPNLFSLTVISLWRAAPSSVSECLYTYARLHWPTPIAFQHVQYLSQFTLRLVQRHFPCAISTIWQKNTAKLGSAPVLVYVLLTIVVFTSFALISFLYLALSRQWIFLFSVKRSTFV